MKRPITSVLVCLCAFLATGCGSGDEEGGDAVATSADVNHGDGQLDGEGAEPGCPPGLTGCVGPDRVVCNKEGTAFDLVACAEGTYCAVGDCVECAEDNHCAVEQGEVCAAGVCGVPELKVLTEALPAALLGQSYAAQLEATGGAPPYKWALPQGTMPDGLLLESSGKLGGVAKAKGKASVLVQVTDSKDKTADRILVVEVVEGGLLIVTPSPLKKAIDGAKYAVQFEAKGGDKPHFWGKVGGDLPNGLALGADGSLSGTPTQDGAFTFDIKAFDNGSPTQSTTKAFELNVGLAPLEVVGDQEVNLLIAKLIVLPLIVVVNGIPIPYNAKLQAKGGKKPYAWVEEPLPAALKGFVPNGGLPKGLKMAADGTISGSVTDPKLAVEVKIPLSQIALKGFFFGAKVTDSQSKAKSKTAIFIIPTAPVG